MKKAICALLAAAMLLACACALAQHGFAEVAKRNVNMREAPGGSTKWQLDSPQSVFVFEERTVGDYLWCHVYTYIGKNPRSGWIRGDMLRFADDEFAGVAEVAANDRFIMGIRQDGTVAIMGDDMPHSPCVQTVRTWKDVTQVCGESVGVQALTSGGQVLAVGRQGNLDGMRADRICGDYAYPLNSSGQFLHDNWNSAWQWDTAQSTAWLGDGRYRAVEGRDLNVDTALTIDGRILFAPVNEPLGQSAYADWNVACSQLFTGGSYTAMDKSYAILAALRADGTVQVSSFQYPDACRTQEWTDVVRVSAGGDFVLGLRGDGTVLYAGADEDHARRVRGWTDVIDVAAGSRFSIALFADGHVEMAGLYSEEYFR